MTSTNKSLRDRPAWKALEAHYANVRELHLRQLFADDAVAFGTWARAVAGLDNIVREQWQNVWPRIRDFRFEADTRVRVSGDSAWIAGGWLTEVTGADGRPVTRPGRGTFVLIVLVMMLTMQLARLATPIVLQDIQPGNVSAVLTGQTLSVSHTG